MRTPTENKSIIAAANGAKCPQCGRKGGACRAVQRGHWCQRDGLVEDPDRVIHPSPDPIHQAVRDDVEVRAARGKVDLAQAEYDKRHEAWLAALSDLETARVTGGTVHWLGDGSAPRMPRRDARREERLLEAESDAKREREKAGDALVEARVRHQKVASAARRRLTAEATR